MGCNGGGNDGFLHGEFATRVRWRVCRDLRNMSAIAAGAWVTFLTVEAVTIYLLTV